MIVVLTLGVAGVGGLLARRFRVPGGALVGALLATGLASQAVGEIHVPPSLRTALFIGVGVMIGTVVTRTTVRALRFALLPALGAAVLILCCGVGVAMLLRALGIAPSGDVLATSPGGLSVLTAAALEGGHDASTVALFHVTRIFIVMLSLPLLTRLLPSPPPAPTAGRPVMDGPTSDEGPSSDRTSPSAADASAPPASTRRRWRPETGAVRQHLLTVVGAAVGGLGLGATGLGGALVLGSTIGAGVVTLAHRRPRRWPEPVMLVESIGLGWLVGSLLTRDTVAGMGAAVGPAVLTAVLLIGAGIAISFLLRALGHAPPGDVLATSPGAMEALATTALERDIGPLQVAVFHIVRILVVILSLPLLLSLTD